MPALKIKARPKVKKGAGSSAPQPEKLTIEEAREKLELGTIDRAVAECGNLNELKDQARELTNATNRAKTQAGKALNALILNETLKKGDKILVGDNAFFYDYAVSDVIPSEDFFKLFETGKISRETFLKVISVPKDMATKLVGAHILDELIKPKVGNKADVRIEKLDKPISEPYIISKKQPPKPKLKKEQHEPVTTVTGTRRKPVRRKITLR